ncbi:MAG: VOC family protein, partial [Mycobacteriaceae bacterium]|nr:VOC family protein [Mycobacteriaceae bacterium]
RADISLSYAGDMQLELIAPLAGESIYTEFLQDRGPGLHHICIEASDGVAKTLDEVSGSGATVVQRGVMPGGLEFAYVAAAAAGVPYLEIAHFPAEIRAFFDYVKKEQK